MIDEMNHFMYNERMSENLHQGHRERIRKAYLEQGMDGMADHAVLELLLTYAIPRCDVNETAHLLLNKFGNLNDVLSADPRALMQVRGIGESAAAFLHLVFDTHRRLNLLTMQNANGRVRLETPQDACRYALALAASDRNETLRVISLDASMTVLHDDILEIGTPTKVHFEPRRVVETALLHKARFLILTHNHPSNILVPSADDIETAKMIQEVASKLEIDVRDQLILTKNAAYSYQSDRVFFFSTPAICHAMTLEEYCDTICAPRVKAKLS